MGLIDFWNNLFGVKEENVFKKTRGGNVKKPTKKKLAKKTQHKTKTAKKGLKKAAGKKSGKSGNKKARKKKNIASGEVRKRTKKNTLGHYKKRVKPSVKQKRKLKEKSKEKEIGIITHYFGKISVGIIKLKTSLKIGDKIHIKGVHDDFTQVVRSMQINRKDVLSAKKGKEIGIKVIRPAHENDKVYAIEE